MPRDQHQPHRLEGAGIGPPGTLEAREDLAKQKLPSAKNRLEKAVRIYPDYATAWYELGRLQARQGETEQAAASYRQSAKADPTYINPLIELALMAATSLQWPEAEQRAEAILKMAPNSMPGVYLVQPSPVSNQKKMDLREASATPGRKPGCIQSIPEDL